MPYDNAYDNFFNDRVIGQVPAKGYSLKGRYQSEWPMRSYFQNRAVGQTPATGYGGNYSIDPGPTYTTGMGRPQRPDPATDAFVPTTVYSGDVQGDINQSQSPTPEQSIGDGNTLGIKARHIVILLVLAMVATVLIVK